MLGQVYGLEVLEREIKRTNGRLTKRNAELYDSLQEIKTKNTKLEESNLKLRKEKVRLCTKIRLTKLQIRNPSPQPQAHQKMETLAEVAISLFGLEAACDTAAKRKSEINEGQRQYLQEDQAGKVAGEEFKP